MKRTFGVVQRAFQFTLPDDVDAQISYLINPRKILIIYSNMATFNVMPCMVQYALYKISLH